MNKISPALSVSQVQDYYKREYAHAGARSYYTEGGKLLGEWWGKLAASWELVGAVDPLPYNRLAEGKDPHTGEQLIRWRRQEQGTDKPWLLDTDAWRERLTGLYVEAFESGLDPLRDSRSRVPSRAAIEGDLPKPKYDEKQTVLVEMHAIAAAVYQDTLAADVGVHAREYLASRKIELSTAKEFGVGLSDGHRLYQAFLHFGPERMEASGLFVRRQNGALTERFEGRLVFPIHDTAGNIIAFGGRKLSDDAWGPKYLNSPATELYSKSEQLYNLHRARPEAQKAGQMVMVEGYTDVMAAHQSGVQNVVATSGTALSDQQICLLKTAAHTAILSLDRDGPGQKATDKHLPHLLEAGLQVRVANLPPGKDPAKLVETEGADAYRQTIERSQSLLPWLTERARTTGSSDPMSASDAVHRIIDALAHVAPENRERMERHLRAHLRLPKQDVLEVSGEPPKRSEHRAGWDLTFSAPKSVSVSALVGGDERILRWHDEAVKEALNYGENWIQARVSPRDVETTANGAFALFTHDTSPPVDGFAAPQLHTHTVMFNMSRTADGRVRPLNPLEMFRLQTTLSAVYQNALALKLKSGGYEIEYGIAHSIQIKGYTDEYLKAASPRTEQIEQGKEEIGRYGPVANQQVNLWTRQAKLDVPPEEIRRSHLEQAAQFGDQPQRVVTEARERPGVTYSDEYRRGVAHDGIGYARQRLIERKAVFDEYEVTRDALRFGRGYIALDDVRKAFEERTSTDFHEVRHWRTHAPGRRFTTPEMIAMERGILNFVHEGIGAVAPIVRNVSQDEFRQRFRELNDGQKWLVWNTIHSTDRVVGIQGGAGVGKTRILGPLKDFTEAYGYEVRGIAATSQAVNELSAVGVRSETIQGFLASSGKQSLRPRAYFVDESTLVDTEQMHGFLGKVKPLDRVFLIGDRRQHGSVGAGRIFAELQDAGMTTFRLGKIVRQQSDELKAVVQEFAQGNTEKGVQLLDAQGRIREYESRNLRHHAIAKAFAESTLQTLAVSRDNQSCNEISAVVREWLQRAGRLEENGYRARTLQSRLDLTNEDKLFAPSFRPGDVVRFMRPKKELGMQKSDYAAVLSVNPASNELTVMRERDGAVLTYNAKQAGKSVQVYEPVYREFATGERVQFTAPFDTQRGGQRYRVPNRATGTITALESSGAVTVKLDNGKTVSWNLEQMPHLEYAYAMTSYIAQSKTTERVLFHVETDTVHRNMLTRQFAYVGLSRGSLDIQVFTDNREALGPALSRSEQRPTALSRDEIAEYRAKAAPTL